MNWRISFLDRYRLVSNSDAHSPGKLGREATTFDCDMDYFAIRRALDDLAEQAMEQAYRRAPQESAEVDLDPATWEKSPFARKKGRP